FSTETDFHAAIERIFQMSPEDRHLVGQRLREWVVGRHSLSAHMIKMKALVNEQTPVVPLRQRVHRWMWYLSPCGQSGLPVYMFHSMDNLGPVGWDPDRLCALLIRLQSSGYRFVSLRELWSGES